MSFSGTVSQTTFNTRRVIDHAMRRCKIPAQTITSEHHDIAKDCLYLLLSDLANGPVPIWAIQKTIYPFYEGINTIVTYEGTVDILNANFRKLQPVQDSSASAVATWNATLSAATQITTVGIKWSAPSVSISLQSSPDGVNWTTIQNEAPSAVAGQWTWFDLDIMAPVAYFRIVAITGTISASRIYLGNTPTEIPMAPMNRDDFTALSNKPSLSYQVYQYWLDRQALSPVLNLWPTPNASVEVCQAVVWAHRHIMDVGTLAQELEIPQRWYEAVVSGLAAKLAMEVTEVDASLVPILDSKAAAAMANALNSNVDTGPFNLMPSIRGYTR